jgi:hypothetical protein
VRFRRQDISQENACAALFVIPNKSFSVNARDDNHVAGRLRGA